MSSEAVKTAGTAKDQKELVGAAVPAVPPTDPDFIVELRRPVDFFGETITEVDMSRLKTLTVKDGYMIEGYVLQRSDVKREPTVFSHPYYMHFLAHTATGLPIELFEGMPTRTRLGVYHFLDDYLSVDDGVDTDSAVLELLDPFTLSGKAVTELNLSGLDDITAADENKAEQYAKRRPELREYVKLGRVRQHPAFIHYLAAAALGVNPEDFQAMSFRDGMRLRLLVMNFLFA